MHHRLRLDAGSYGVSDALQRIVREVADEWSADGRLSDPADGIEDDQDEEFWAEVRRRMVEAE
jgi:hypothetical protein